MYVSIESVPEQIFKSQISNSKSRDNEVVESWQTLISDASTNLPDVISIYYF